MLSGGDLRSEGRAADVAAFVIGDPPRLADLCALLTNDDKLLRARACMAMEVLSRTHPELLVPVMDDLLAAAAVESVAQARWHLAEIFTCVPLTDAQKARTTEVLKGYLGDKSKIVRFCAAKALETILEGEYLHLLS
jgi:hypothetical protein